jgi:hypothetical protein
MLQRERVCATQELARQGYRNQSDGKERRTQVRRIVVIILSVILALVVAAPIASGQTSSQSQDLGKLTGDWWNWAFATSPSPLEGSYTGGGQCNGRYVNGVFFLAGAAGGAPPSVERTCTVPANTPILFPVVNVICSEAFGVAGQDPPDPQPYDTACAEPATDATIDPPSHFYAKVDGNDANQQRIASGLFQWTIASDNNPFGLFAGTYEAASDGLWVYLADGLNTGNHTVQFGGTYKHTPFGDFEGTKVTYNLTVRR